MIVLDKKNKQVLTPHCSFCPETFFSPAEDHLPRVGCCSYSPLFGLFELSKMAQHNETFLRTSILNHENAQILPYQIKVHANVDPSFYKQQSFSLTKLERDDLKLRYSVCVFLKQGEGCSLPPFYKNIVCRSFICPTVESMLSETEQHHLQIMVRTITQVASQFHIKHEKKLIQKGIDLLSNPNAVISYLKEIKHIPS
ncbi:hypothetical protein [Halalkalibacterium ligniniphilum]|uniref:hypothetical protein n=1 Tax=Halalkalibacterium ligniniphilum TaxID=1134413 RepID=UPI0003491685|nr:hypothetical protein [Halalkalibacterium ligniniphilum]